MPPKKDSSISYIFPATTPAIDTEKYWRNVMTMANELVAEVKTTMEKNDRSVITFTSDSIPEFVAMFIDKGDVLLISTEKMHRLVEQPIEIIIRIATFLNKWLKLIN